MSKSIYRRVVELGVPFDNHESDLYVKHTPEVVAMLNEYNAIEDELNVYWSTFSNQRPPNVGELWIDIPFMFDPFWEKA